MNIAISPHYTPKKLQTGSINDKIDVFEDQITGWLIQPAKKMLGEQHAGYAILTLCLSYFEPIGQFLDGGRGKSGQQFTRGLEHVFSGQKLTPKTAHELYDQLRCGMFHQG